MEVKTNDALLKIKLDDYSSQYKKQERKLKGEFRFFSKEIIEEIAFGFLYYDVFKEVEFAIDKFTRAIELVVSELSDEEIEGLNYCIRELGYYPEFADHYKKIKRFKILDEGYRNINYISEARFLRTFKRMYSYIKKGNLYILYLEIFKYKN